MRQQMSNQSYTQNLLEPNSSNFVSPTAGATAGNSNAQAKMLMVTDMNAWLDLQLSYITGMSADVQKQRINGIMQTVKGVDHSYQQGQDIRMTQLPMAPLATEEPKLDGMSPELRGVIENFNFKLALKQQEGRYFSGTFGLMGNEGNTLDQGLLIASAGAVQISTQLQSLATKINGLKLPLPGQKGLYSVAQYGDFSSLVKILEACVSEGIRSPDQVAYILATAWIESHMGDWMTEGAWLSKKTAEREAEYKYGPNGEDPRTARKYGNTNAGDGSKYMGRGFVQLTWKNNYQKMSQKLVQVGFKYTHNGVTYGDGKNGTQAIDLVKNYTHVNENKDLAAKILVMGMDQGLYVQDGLGLDHYIPENQPATNSNFQNARRIVNGSDKKREIANIAVTIATHLKAGDAWIKAFNK